MFRKIFQTQSLGPDAAALLLRLILGGFFTWYGWMKIEDYDKIIPQFPDIIGIGARLSYHLVIFAEFVCGILVMAGCFTRIALVPMFISMCVAFFIALKKQPFLEKQLPFLYLFLIIAVFITGSGRFSVDTLLLKKMPPAGKQVA